MEKSVVCWQEAACWVGWQGDERWWFAAQGPIFLDEWWNRHCTLCAEGQGALVSNEWEINTLWGFQLSFQLIICQKFLLLNTQIRVFWNQRPAQRANLCYSFMAWGRILQFKALLNQNRIKWLFSISGNCIIHVRITFKSQKSVIRVCVFSSVESIIVLYKPLWGTVGLTAAWGFGALVLFFRSPKDGVCLRCGGHLIFILCHHTEVTKLPLPQQRGQPEVRGRVSLEFHCKISN